MSSRGIERVQPAGAGGAATNVNIQSFGGTAVAPAAPKADGQDNTINVPEFGSRTQFFNGVSWDPGRSGFTGPLTAPFLGLQNSLPMAVFHAVAPVLVDGQAVTLQCDASGALRTSGGSGSNASVGLTGAAVPASATFIGAQDAAGNLAGPRCYDLDTGGGVENALGVNLRFSAGGGSVEAGTTTNPITINTAQLPPALIAGMLLVGVGASVLPTGAATEATLATLAAAAQLPAALVGGRLDTNIGAWLGATTPTVGQKTMAASIPVVIASDQTAITVAQGTAAAAAAPWATRLSDGAAFYDAAKTGQLPAALVGGRLDSNVGTWIGSAAPTVGQKTMANSVPVVVSSDQTALSVTPTQPATSSVTSVASNVASVTLLAANANRKVATIVNDSATANLYVKLGAAATTSSYTVKMVPGAYYEVPNPVYTGVIDGIWDVAVGNARITELTP